MIPPLITTDLTYYWQKREMCDVFSEQERDHYMTMGEIGRIRKDIERESIRLDPNDAKSTRIWVETLQSEGNFVRSQYEGILLFTMMARDHWGKGM